jgi:hypothetical protein
MKKQSRILIFFLLILGLFACEDEIGPIINSAAEDGTLSFQLNEPSYSDLTYVLEEDNADLDMEELTCAQPDYGFTAAVTYTSQVSMSSSFDTFISLGTTVTGEMVGVNTKEMNKALISLNDGAFSEPLPSLEIYMRLKAVISTAVNNPVDNDTIVEPLYSNTISINIMPYIEPLYPYTEVTPSPWYIVGLGNVWDNNSNDDIGSSLIPLSVVDGDKYDAASGNGTFTYTGYFVSDEGFKLIQTPGSWSDQWGNTTDGGIDDPVLSGNNFGVPADGWYTITLNSIDDKLTIEETTAPESSYTSMGLIGEFNSWAEDVSMTANGITNSHIWYTTYTFDSDYTTDGGCKFRANSGWDFNWGAASFPVGIGELGGDNIPFEQGTYTVVLNDIDGCFYFIQ